MATRPIAAHGHHRHRLPAQTHQYAYLLTTGSGSAKSFALNNHEFLVDERDGKGLAATDSNAKVKQLFKIDLAGAVDVTTLDGTTRRRTR